MEVRIVDPTKEDLRYLDGPWSNDACMGYVLMAMRRAGLSEKEIQKVTEQMIWCFDDTTVDEAAKYLWKNGRP